MDLLPGSLPEVAAQDLFNKSGTRKPGTGQAVHLGQKISRKCDGCLLFHTTNILRILMMRDYPHFPGCIPWALYTAAASGDEIKSNRAFAAVGFLA